jgi:hypothetical protein
MILVSLRYDGGVAAVYRDGRETWLGTGPVEDEGDTASLGGMLLDDRHGQVGVGGGRWAVGGLLPPGAADAVVEGQRGVAGHGAWIALVDAPGPFYEFATRYEAEDGTIVRPPLPAGWAREPVPDADEPCPACGAATWERVTPTDESRGTGGPLGGPTEPSAVVVCTQCGYEVGEGSWYGPGASGGRAPWRRWRASRQRRKLRPHLPEPPPLADAGFPVYALAGAAAEASGSGWDREGLHSMTLRQEGIEVTTRARRHAFTEADEECLIALRSMIEDADPLDWGRGSHAARALRISAHFRAVAARAGRAEPFAVELPVDGAPVRFAAVRDPAGWAAVGDTAEVRIVIAARRVAPEAVALERRV